MYGRRKVFRIESNGYAPDMMPAYSYAPPVVTGGDGKGDEILAELRALRALIKPTEEISRKVVENFKTELAEAAKLKAELDEIQKAILRTKQEIATVHVTGFNGPQMARVTNELDAIVSGTEGATETILASAEEIDNLAAALMQSATTEQQRGMVADVQDKVVQIFEACNFQDLTGQRITKVVNTLKFIEDRIVRMMEIWGGLEAFREFEAENPPEKCGDAKLLNGPKLQEDEGHVSQDEIDALFN